MRGQHWTSQDVERYREQQRWRMRQEHQQHGQLPALDDMSHALAMVTDTEDNRQRKVSYKFRREHQHFLAHHHHQQQQQQHHQLPQDAVDSIMRHRVVVKPTVGSFHARPRIESPLPHANNGMFDAFDSATSPEAFAFEHGQHDSNNQDDTADGDDDMAMDASDESQDHRHHDSLWRRRFAQHRRSPKLGQNALWDAFSITNPDNQLMEHECTYQAQLNHAIQRVPHPFASDNDDEL